jgi:hypothetical protein
MIATVGEIVKLKSCFYVVVNQNGTLEKLRKPKLWKRLFVEIRQGCGIYFKSPKAAKQYLFPNG